MLRGKELGGRGGGGFAGGRVLLRTGSHHQASTRQIFPLFFLPGLCENVGREVPWYRLDARHVMPFQISCQIFRVYALRELGDMLGKCTSGERERERSRFPTGWSRCGRLMSDGGKESATPPPNPISSFSSACQIGFNAWRLPQTNER